MKRNFNKLKNADKQIEQKKAKRQKTKEDCKGVETQ